jgi:hypothetical protein
MLGKLIETWKKSKGARSHTRLPTYRPFLEALEERLVPAVISTWNWNVNSGLQPNWSLAGNWTNGVPKVAGVGGVAGDQATFDGTSVGNCTVDIAVALDELTITNAYTGTITVNTSLKTGNPNPALTSSMANGILTGQGIEIVAATFNWTGGTFQNTSQMRVDGGATWNITGAATKTLDSVLNLSLLANSIGTWDGAGTIVFKNASLIVNSGSFTISGGGTMQDSGGGVNEFSNQGTLNVSPGANNIAMIHVKFENLGAVPCNVQSGTLQIDGGSNLQGTVTVSGGAQLTLASINTKLDSLNGVTITGSGTLLITAHASVVAASTVDCQTTYDRDVSVDGGSDLTITKNYYWKSGNWTGAGKMIIKGNLILNNTLVGGYPLGRTIDNYNIVTWSASDIQVSTSANITNENGATFHIQTDNNILNAGNAGSFLNKAGALVVKDGGTATTRIDLVFFPDNAGTIKVTAQGARIKFTPFMLNFGGLSITVTNAGMDFSAGLEQDSGSTVGTAASNATITVAGGNFVLKGGTVSASGAACGISVTGQYQQSGGTSTPGAYSTFSATDTIVETGGTIELQGGTLSGTNGVQVQSGSILQGYGFVSTSTLTNSGTINPGDIGTIGTITITGNYTQTSSGVLNEDITYSPPPGGATSDQLAVSGVATLSGTLNISSIGSAPSPGPTLELLTYGSRNGSWTSINLPPPPGYGHWADGFYDGGNPGYFYLSDVVP